MVKDNWSKQQENEFKDVIKHFFEDRILCALATNEDSLKIGDNLASILKNSDEDVVRIITPRAIKKWASRETLPKWEKIIEDKRMLIELRMIGKSIANTMRPLAGNNFALWVAKLLNICFEKNNIPIEAITSGQVIREINKSFIVKSENEIGSKDYKPDIDIVLVRTESKEPIAIISAKTTLAERVMQTISWSRFIKNAPQKYNHLKIFLVTAWDTFESGTNKDRVQELDGVYVCNKEVKEYGKIKLFSRIVDDIKKLL
jgi:hypothetical protein